MHQVVLLAVLLLVSLPAFAFECPSGTTLLGSAGKEQWCALQNKRGDYLRHGPYRLWNRNGRVVASGRFDHGEQTGIWNLYYADGTTKETSVYVHGEYHGLVLRYCEAGQLEVRSEWKNGVQNGDLTEWDGCGESWYRVSRTATYRNGELDGPETRFNHCGVERYTEFKDGKMHGNIEAFNGNCNQDRAGVYEEDRAIRVARFDDAGQLYHVTERLDAQSDICIEYANGQETSRKITPSWRGCD